MPEPQWLSLAVYAAQHGRSRRTVVRYVARGELAYVRRIASNRIEIRSAPPPPPLRNEGRPRTVSTPEMLAVVRVLAVHGLCTAARLAAVAGIPRAVARGVLRTVSRSTPTPRCGGRTV